MKAATYLLALALLAALGALWRTDSALDAERLAHQTTKTTYAAQVAAAERVAREQSEKYRTKEQELRDAEETHGRQIAALHVARDRDRAAGAAVAVRLRDAARSTATLAGAICADTATAELRQAAGAAAGMLAELRERADERAGILAAFATDAHLAGLACQRRYDDARHALSTD